MTPLLKTHTCKLHSLKICSRASKKYISEFVYVNCPINFEYLRNLITYTLPFGIYVYMRALKSLAVLTNLFYFSVPETEFISSP